MSDRVPPANSLLPFDRRPSKCGSACRRRAHLALCHHGAEHQIHTLDEHILARNLPYGVQRRLEIARAIATGARVLLLDEPAAGMNGAEKGELMEMIRFVRER